MSVCVCVCVCANMNMHTHDDTSLLSIQESTIRYIV